MVATPGDGPDSRHFGSGTSSTYCGTEEPNEPPAAVAMPLMRAVIITAESFAGLSASGCGQSHNVRWAPSPPRALAVKPSLDLAGVAKEALSAPRVRTSGSLAPSPKASLKSGPPSAAFRHRVPARGPP